MLRPALAVTKSSLHVLAYDQDKKSSDLSHRNMLTNKKYIAGILLRIQYYLEVCLTITSALETLLLFLLYLLKKSMKPSSDGLLY